MHVALKCYVHLNSMRGFSRKTNNDVLYGSLDGEEDDMFICPECDSPLMIKAGVRLVCSNSSCRETK